MKAQLKGEQIAIVGLVAAGIVLAAAGYFFLVSPQSSDKSKLADEIATAQTQLIVAKGASAKPVPFRASDLFRLARAMPESVDMPGVLLELNLLARASALQVTSVRPSPQVSIGLGYSSVPIAVTVSGSYRGIAKFEELLRTDVHIAPNTLRVNGRLFDTDNISLAPAVSTTPSSSGNASSGAPQGTAGSAAKTKQQANTINATLSLDAFIFGGAPAVAATAGSAVSGSTTTTTTGAA